MVNYRYWIDIIFFLLEGCILSFSMIILLKKDLEVNIKDFIVIIICTGIYCFVIFSVKDLVSDFLLTGIRVGLLFVFSVFLGKASFSLRFVAIGMTLFIYTMIGNLIDVILVLFDSGMHTSIRFAFLRLTYNNALHYIRLSLHIGIQAGCMIVFKRRYNKLQSITQGYQLLVAILAMFFSFMMQLFLSVIINNTRFYSDVIYKVAWILLIFGMILVLGFFLFFIETETTQIENRMIRTMNYSISMGYSLLADKNDELRMQAHNFRNHLLALQKMDETEAHRYLQNLLQSKQNNSITINSGNRFIDVVLNSKMSLIDENQIEFQYNIRTLGEIDIPPADLCVIISNQIDNAIEACCKINEKNKRWIRFLVDQRGNILAIICENSIVNNSVSIDHLKRTTKTKEKHLHGLGIRSIEFCAERNNGVLVNEINETLFRSKVVLFCNSDKKSIHSDK